MTVRVFYNLGHFFHDPILLFQDANEEIRGGLFVIKSVPTGKLAKKTDCFRVSMVFDGDYETRQDVSLSITESQEIKFSQLYRRSYEHNRTILEAIERSIKANLTRADYRLYLNRVQNQAESVKEYYYLKGKHGAVDPVQFLIRDRFDRRGYMTQ